MEAVFQKIQLNQSHIDPYNTSRPCRNDADAIWWGGSGVEMAPRGPEHDFRRFRKTTHVGDFSPVDLFLELSLAKISNAFFEVNKRS